MKAFYKYLFVFGLIISRFSGYSQNRISDSLLLMAKNATNDSLQLEYYNVSLSYIIGIGELKLADSILETLDNLQKNKFQKIKTLYYKYNKGYVYEMRGLYTKALDNYFEALKLAEAENKLSIRASIHSNIGVIYFSQNEFDRALQYYLKAIELLKKSGSAKGFAVYYNNVGNVYYSKKDYTKALEYYKLSLELRKKVNSELGVANSLNNIGSIYMELKQYEKALACFEQALETQKKNNDRFNLAYSYLNKGEVYTKQKKFSLAETNILEGLKLAVEINYPDALRDSYHALADVYEEKKDDTKALKYYKLFVQFRDSLTNEQQLKAINEREMNNEIFQKEVLLKAENERQNFEHIEKEKRDKIFIYSTLIVLILILVFSVFLFNRYKLIESQKKVIEEKNKEVIDSINYAKRIQTAILLPEEELAKHFQEIFVLFKPKDIVSGDFYWFSESEHNKIIAVVDCTGHGVPGGFMSMLGFESLQEVALRENVTSTSQALKSLDKKITETLNKSSRSFRDGMDLALCAFDKKQNTLQYSGANRPLIQISNGVLIEYKPDKNTIGGDIDDTDKKYSTKIINYSKGDVFYMFSDGYADQFGGPNGRKFMMKQLKELLVSISGLPLKEQKEKLDSAIDLWRGNLEQVDDVCVIGIRV